MADDPLDAPFRKPVLAGLVAVAAGSLALAIALAIVQPDVEVESIASDSFSHSALGHSAFVELLHARHVPVLVSRYASAERAGGRALLVLAEPSLEGDDGRARRLHSMVAAAHNVLLVLPKWRGRADPAHRGWVGGVERLPSRDVLAVLTAAGVPASPQEGGAQPGSCAGTAARLDLVLPQLLSNADGRLRPLVTCGDGVLLGEMVDGPRRVVVLSDPDALANHGLGRADHAAFALEIVERARPAGQTVIVDETLHGHERVPSLWRELFVFPLLPAVLQAALALAALILSGLGRFGAPLPAPPALASGKSVLIDNTAALMRTAGHSAHALGRYFEAAVADVAAGLHAPVREPARLAAWLRGQARGRRPGLDLASVQKQVENAQHSEAPSAAEVMAAARRTHRWRREMLRGPEEHPGR